MYSIKDEKGKIGVSQRDGSYILNQIECAYSNMDWDLLRETEDFVESLLGRRPVGNWQIQLN